MSIMDAVIAQFGGPQQFQQQMNAAQNELQKCNMTPEQFLQSKLQSGELSQDRLNAAIQKVNSLYGRR